MSFTSVPIIVVCCYVIGEIIKFIFRNKQETYKIIPIVVTSIGGLLGILIYLTNPEIIFNVDSIDVNIIDAVSIFIHLYFCIFVILTV